jgi:proton-dependent oligopeptide transporter, POT family
MSTATGVDTVEMATATANNNVPVSEKGAVEELKGQPRVSDSDSLDDVLVGPNGEQYPTAEELKSLRRIAGHVPWILYSIAFVELCERFAYYGTTIVCAFPPL